MGRYSVMMPIYRMILGFIVNIPLHAIAVNRKTAHIVSKIVRDSAVLMRERMQ
jgi:hypothetical protein